jgi:hypothetical protein
MKKLMLLISLTMLIQSCSLLKRSKVEERPENIDNQPTESTPTQVEGEKTLIKIESLSSFTSSEKEKLSGVVDKCNFVINSKQFKQGYLELDLNKYDNQGKTNAQIYFEFMSGKDNYEDQPDKTINLHLKRYTTANPWSKVKGYTKKGTKFIFENSRWIMRMKDCSTCGHYVHEYHHNLGYSHPVKSRWPTSVPYASGNLANEVCQEFENE